MQIDVQMLLDSFEAPAIFYRENTVRYFNQWAKVLFPSLTSGRPLPEGFDSPSSPLVPEVHAMQRGTLYLFRPRLGAEATSDLAQVTRELRACLTTLTAANDQLAARLKDSLSPEGEQLMQLSNRSLCRLRRLADHSDLLREMEGGDHSVYREGALDLVSLTRELGEHMELLTHQAGIPFRLDCQEPALPTLGDPSLLRRMLLNLLSNALRAVREGGEVGLRLEKREGRALFTVWDNGPGMEERQLLAVFRPQPRRHRLPDPEEGAAMGLRLAREVAVLHQGVILAENRPGGGVSMTVSLPVRKLPPNTLRSTPAWGEDSYLLALTELADVLPASLYAPEELRL